MSGRMSRREFGASAALLAQFELPRVVTWADRPMRWGQLTLVDNDPGEFDARWWIDYFRRTHCDGVCLSAGGTIAYYPTRIEYHYRSAWMKPGSDPFGELVKGCREAKMVILARVDPHSIRDDAAQAHPEWVQVQANGERRRHWAAPGRWVTCALGPYNFDFMTGVIGEISAMYKVEGVFANRWQGHGICYCGSCRKLFAGATGLDLDRAKNSSDREASEAWRKWRHDRLLELWDVWDRKIREINADGCFVANAGGGAASEFDMLTIAAKSPMMAADRQSRDARTVSPWINGRNAKEYRAAAGLKPVAGIFAIGRDDQYRWKDSVQQADEMTLFAADGIAQGLRPWYTKFAGYLWDKRWTKPVEELYTWHWKNEAYLRHTANLARVAIVLSQQSARHYPYPRYEDHELGFYQALVESRIPFEMVHEGLLDASLAERFKLLILPNVACLSDAQCRQLTAFSAHGGSIVAAFETSLYDERGRARPDFGLANLLGARYTGRTERLIRNSYMRVDAATRHPVIAGLEDAGRIINTTQRVYAEPVANLDALPLTQVPSYPDLPMEEVYPREPVTKVPDLYLRQRGNARVAYFPGDIGRTFWEILDGDHLTLLRNTIRWALDEPAIVKVEGPGFLDLAVWRQEQSMTLHMVNLTNPMMMKGPVRGLYPSGPQQVELRLPFGPPPRTVRLLTSRQQPKADFKDGVLKLTVPSFPLHEVVAIDF